MKRAPPLSEIERVREKHRLHQRAAYNTPHEEAAIIVVNALQEILIQNRDKISIESQAQIAQLIYRHQTIETLTKLMKPGGHHRAGHAYDDFRSAVRRVSQSMKKTKR